MSAEMLPDAGPQQASASRSGEPVTVLDPSKVTATHIADINVKTDGDYDDFDCRISGSAFVSAGRLLLADSCNNKVKLVDTGAQKLLSALELTAQPWSVAAINTNQAVVTLPDSRTILILGVADTLTSQREISVDGPCYGVAYSQDRLVVTYMMSPTVEVIDLQGNVIRRLENASDGSKLFDFPGYVRVSKDGETIYVSNETRNAVASLTFDGELKAVYTDTELRRPKQICTDHNGNVYVCGYESDNVHMITADCGKIKVILTKDTTSDLWSVCHCEVTNRLFIGMHSNNNVRVYQLS